MSQNSNFLKNTLDLLETDPEVKAYIYQQVQDFNPYVTPETMIMVVARDPQAQIDEAAAFQAAAYQELPGESHDEDEPEEPIVDDELKNYKYRIAIILKEGEHPLEAEAYSDDVFDAIRLAKEALLQRLIEIQDEVESSQDRVKAINEATENKQIH